MTYIIQLLVQESGSLRMKGSHIRFVNSQNLLYRYIAMMLSDKMPQDVSRKATDE